MVARTPALTRAEADELRASWHNPRHFISKLWIQNERRRLTRLNPLWMEQEAWLEALCTRKYVIGVKPRQVGFTTITTAYFFWKLYTSKHPLGLLQVAHESRLLRRLANMLKLFRDRMPPPLRAELERHNVEETLFGHNGAEVIRTMAGGRNQGRGFTFTDLHGTEMSKWPQGSAATNAEEGEAADEELFASALATMHDSEGQVVIESSGNGPRGLFHDLWLTSGTDPEWGRVFIPWTKVPRYRRPVANREAFLDTLDSDETVLYKNGRGLTVEQLAFRRHKLRTERYSRLRFRREYPIDEMDPFLLDESGWFSQEAIQSLLATAKAARIAHPEWADAKATEQVFFPYEKGRRYYLGGDPSGGTGGDEATIKVFDDRLREVYHFASNRIDPDSFALQVARVGGMYGGEVLAVIEANNHGRRVLSVLRAMGAGAGVILWTDRLGHDFYSTGGRAGNSKLEAMAWARTVVDNEHLLLHDTETVIQLGRIVEKPKNGKIEGSGSSHDDRAMAVVLALWGARGVWSSVESATLEQDRERYSRILEQHRQWGFDGPR